MDQTKKDEQGIENKQEDFFEGIEKRLDIEFLKDVESKENLFSLTTLDWTEILQCAKCSILSYIETEHIRAFLLSESSLFVRSNSLMLKTCGKTTLLACISRLLELVKLKCHLVPIRIQYSHQNFLEPTLQPYPYNLLSNEKQEWENIISQICEPNWDSKEREIVTKDSYVWFVWQREKIKKIKRETVYEITQTSDIAKETIDVLKEGRGLSRTEIISDHCFHVNEQTPSEIRIDQHWFQPQGYSANLILVYKTEFKCDGRSQSQTFFYVTIHFTPQKTCPYLSVESNLSENLLNYFAKTYLCLSNFTLRSL